MERKIYTLISKDWIAGIVDGRSSDKTELQVLLGDFREYEGWASGTV